MGDTEFLKGLLSSIVTLERATSRSYSKNGDGSRLSACNELAISVSIKITVL
jgi:hypothetical protein